MSKRNRIPWRGSERKYFCLTDEDVETKFFSPPVCLYKSVPRFLCCSCLLAGCEGSVAVCLSVRAFSLFSLLLHLSKSVIQEPSTATPFSCILSGCTSSTRSRWCIAGAACPCTCMQAFDSRQHKKPKGKRILLGEKMKKKGGGESKGQTDINTEEQTHANRYMMQTIEEKE